MDGIGAYAFITKDWRENDYPLDLWLEHHLKLFDQIAIVTYGKVYIPEKFRRNKKLIMKKMGLISEKTFSFYIVGKSEAQRLLTTEWKVMLDVDEFISKRIDVDSFDKKYAYALKYHNLYGNVRTEMIENPFALYQVRIHYGNRKILGDGANVEPPYAARLSIGRLLNSMPNKTRKMSTTSTDKKNKPWGVVKTAFDLLKNPRQLQFQIRAAAYDFDSAPYIEVWHTGTARNPSALKSKWTVQIKREINHGFLYNQNKLSKLSSGMFNYKNYKEIWPNARLVRVKPESLPYILRKNSKRFNWARFSARNYLA